MMLRMIRIEWEGSMSMLLLLETWFLVTTHSLIDSVIVMMTKHAVDIYLNSNEKNQTMLKEGRRGCETNRG